MRKKTSKKELFIKERRREKGKEEGKEKLFFYIFSFEKKKLLQKDIGYYKD